MTCAPCTTKALAKRVAIAVSPLSSWIRNARPNAIFVWTEGGGAAMERSPIHRGNLERAPPKIIISILDKLEFSFTDLPMEVS